MASEFSELYNVTYEEIEAQITSIVTNLKQLGLLTEGTSLQERYVVQVQYAGKQVHIHTDSEEIQKNVIKRFDAMITEDEGYLAGRLGVYQTAKGFTVTGTRLIHISDGNLADAIRAIKHETVLRFIESNPERIWLHAGGIAQKDGAILFAGPWGAGKSTLVSTLYQSGWSYLSDDILPLDPNDFQVSPFPLTPAARYVPDPDDPLPLSLLPKKLTLLEPGTICSTSQPIKAIIFPTYTPEGSNRLTPCSPGTIAVELTKHCQNIDHHKEKGVESLCALASNTPGFFLEYSDGTEASKNIQEWYSTEAL